MVYSVNKGLDYATGFDPKKGGEYKDSALGQAFVEAKEKPDEVISTSWMAYGPNGGAVASFLAKAVRSNVGQVVGVYATQMPPDAKPIESRTLLGETIDEFDEMISGLEFGLPGNAIPPPVNQDVADLIFALKASWETVKVVFQGEATALAVEEVLGKAAGFLAAYQALDARFVTEDPHPLRMHGGSYLRYCTQCNSWGTRGVVGGQVPPP